MTKDKAPDLNFPKTLDLNEWIWYTLDQGDELNRLLALDELAIAPLNEDLSAKLLWIQENDDSQRCRDMAGKILAAESARGKAGQLAGRMQFSPEGLRTLIADLDPAFRQAILKSVRKAPPEELMDLWRSELLGDLPEEIAEVGLTLLARFGKAGDGNFALPFMGSEKPSMVNAAVDLLQAQSPDLFRSYVSRALSYPKVDVQIHAVRKLRSIDPKEAMAYLRAFLKSSDALVRQKALRELMFVPLVEAESTYFQFLSSETRALLLVMAGLSIAFNPHPDLPIKIYDIVLVSQGLKKHILQLMLNQLVDSISRAKILKEPVETYIASLKEKLQKKRDVTMVNLALKDLDHQDPQVRQRAVQTLSSHVSHPKVQEALSRRRETEANEEVKASLDSIFTGRAPVKEQVESGQGAVADTLKNPGFKDLPLEKQKDLIRGIQDPSVFQSCREGLQQLLSHSFHWSVGQEIIQVFARMGETKDVAILLPLIQHAEAPVASAAVRACGKLNESSLKPFFSKLLRHRQPQIRSAAFEVFLKVEKEKAVEYIRNMAFSDKVEFQREAISLLPNLDDFSALPICSQLFLGKLSDELKLRVGEILATNPTLERLQILYQGTHSSDGKALPEYLEFWTAALKAGGETLETDGKKLETQFFETFLKPREATPAPDYSFQNLAAKQVVEAAQTALPEAKTEEKAVSSDDSLLPKSLDIDEWVAYSLGQKEETKRILALEEVAMGPVSQAVLPRIRQLVNNDPSGVCREQAAKILAAEKAREEGGRLGSNFEFAPDSFKALIEGMDPSLSQTFLRSIRKPPPADLIDLWRSHTPTESSPRVVEAGLILLARFGKDEDARFAIPFVGSDHPDVEIAATELLYSRNIELFKEHLPSLLRSSSMKVRMHAIRRLKSVDPKEATLFLNHYLASPDPMIRQQALRELLLIPFAEAEASYLQFLSAETQPLLLIMAGLAVAFNPDPELPLKVYDIFLLTRGEKKHILQLMIDTLLDCINQVGILKEPIAKYLASLKEKLLTRREALSISLAMKDLESSDPEARLSAAEQLRSAISQPEVKEALKKRLAVEKNQDVLAVLNSLAETIEAADEKTIAQVLSSEEFRALPQGKQRSVLGGIQTKGSYKVWNSTLKSVLGVGLTRPVVLELIDKMAAFGKKDDAPALMPLISNPDPAIASAAIKAVGKIDFDSLQAKLNVLLQNNDPRIKAAALEVFIMADKEGAILYLNSLLNSVNQNVRRQVLKLVTLLDYPSAKPMLFDMFASERVMELKIQAGYIIAANPTPDGLLVLYKACVESGKVKEECAELWKSALEAAEPVLGKRPNILENECLQKVQAESQVREKVAPSYAFTKVVDKKAPAELAKAEGEAQKFDFQGLLAKVQENQTVILISVLLFVLFPMVGSILSTGDGPSRPSGLTGKQLSQKNSQASGFEEGTKNVPGFCVGATVGFSSGGGFDPAIQGSENELKKVREELKVANKKALKEYIAEMAKQEVNKGFADFYVNENCSKALDYIESGNYTEAKDYLMKALNDSTVTDEAKLVVCHNLVGVAYELGDKQTLALAMEKLLSMIPPGDLPKDYNASTIRAQIDQMSRMQEIKPDMIKQVMGKMSEKSKHLTPEAQAQLMDGFTKMQDKFK